MLLEGTRMFTQLVARHYIGCPHLTLCSETAGHPIPKHLSAVAAQFEACT